MDGWMDGWMIYGVGGLKGEKCIGVGDGVGDGEWGDVVCVCVITDVHNYEVEERRMRWILISGGGKVM